MVARAFLAAALAVSAYLVVASMAGGGIAGCGPGGGCDEVLHSRWSRWFGVPVSLPALLLDLALLVGTFRVLKAPTPETQRPWRTLLGMGAGLLIAAAIWFVGLQAFAIGHFCPYCCAAHAFGFISGLLLLGWLRRTEAQDPTFPAGRLRGLGFAAVAFAVLAGGQVLVEPKTYKVAGMGAAPGTNAIGTTNPVAAAVTTNPPPASALTPKPVVAAQPQVANPPLLSLHNGRYKIDLMEIPIYGSPSAPKVMVSLFDYTCIHCRAAHGPINAVQHAFSNELAVVALPLPLDSKCNPWIRSTSRAHTNACALALTALAVWRADRTKFREFDDWLMVSKSAPLPEEARSKANELVGLMRMETALTDPWVNQTVQLSVNLYRANWDTLGVGNMPMMVFGTNIFSGTLNGDAQLFGLVERHLGLKRP